MAGQQARDDANLGHVGCSNRQPQPEHREQAPCDEVSRPSGAGRRFCERQTPEVHWTTAHPRWVGFTDSRAGAALVQNRRDATHRVDAGVVANDQRRGGLVARPAALFRGEREGC